jgi:hypothetical protein
LAIIGASRRRWAVARLSPAEKTSFVLQMLLEPFWPSRRVAQFDELCPPAA